MLVVERIEDLARLEDIRPDWDRLAGNNPMRSVVWGETWWRCFGYRCVPYILTVRDRQGIQGILPLALEVTPFRGRRLILIGSGKACGDDLGILSRPGIEQHVGRTLGDWIAEATGEDRWDSLDLDGVQPGKAGLESFQEQLESVHRIPVTRRSSESCWSVEIGGGWDPFLAQLSKRMRRFVKNELIGRYIDSGRARFRVAESIQEARGMLETIAALHQSRWKRRNIDGCFSTHGFRYFLSSLLDEWWKTQQAYVAMIEYEGRPVAGGFGIWCPDELALYLTGMDDSLSEHRPGWLFTVESIRHAIQHGKERFNFLRGDEDYKRRIGAHPTVQQRWLATSPRLIPRLRGAALQKGIEVRDWFRGQSPPVTASLEDERGCKLLEGC